MNQKLIINPYDVVKFDRSQEELELFLLFCCFVPGKSAITTARLLTVLFNQLNYNGTPFEKIKQLSNDVNLALHFKKIGFGCYNQRAKTVGCLINSNIDLFTCTINDLEKVPGIGKKTSRFFLIHSRQNVRYAALDTHILKYLKQKGFDVPKSTPVGKKYDEIEKIFLKLQEKSGKNLAEFDLELWTRFSTKQK